MSSAWMTSTTGFKPSSEPARRGSLHTAKCAAAYNMHTQFDVTCPATHHEQVPPAPLRGSLTLPATPVGLVAFAHAGGSSRQCPTLLRVAEALRRHGLGTFLFDLLRPDEVRDPAKIFAVPLLAERLLEATRWLDTHPETRDLPLAYFGSSSGAAAALVAAARAEHEICGVVSLCGRPDLARPVLPEVKAPTLLIVGGQDRVGLELNAGALDALTCIKKLAVVRGATHLFDDPRKLEEVIDLSTHWLVDHLSVGESETAL